MTTPDDMIQVPRRDPEALVEDWFESAPASDAFVRIRKLLKTPKCGAWAKCEDGGGWYGIPCVLPAGHHAPRRSSVGFACICCTASDDDPIHAGDAHQVDPALWVVP